MKPTAFVTHDTLYFVEGDSPGTPGDDSGAGFILTRGGDVVVATEAQVLHDVTIGKLIHAPHKINIVQHQKWVEDAHAIHRPELTDPGQ